MNRLTANQPAARNSDLVNTILHYHQSHQGSGFLNDLSAEIQFAGFVVYAALYQHSLAYDHADHSWYMQHKQQSKKTRHTEQDHRPHFYGETVSPICT
jgi:hypothetical protein